MAPPITTPVGPDGLTKNQRHYYRAKAKDPDYVKRNNLRMAGITLEEWQSLFTLQRGRCWICRGKFSDTNLPYLDHDHKCCPKKNGCRKCLRGLLCNTCNRAIGFFRDNPTLLRRAADYLDEGVLTWQ